MSGELVWGGVATLVIFLELVGVFGKAKDDTISEMTKLLFHTDTRPGRVTFALTWIGFSVWFFWHILFQGRRPKAK